MKNSLIYLLASTVSSLSFIGAYDSGNKPGWKMDADGHIVLGTDGNPIYVDGSGREMIVDQSTVTRLNGEAMGFRTAKEAAEAKLAEFKDIDPKAAREALEKIKKLNSKELLDAGEVDKLKDQISNEFKAQLTERDNTIATLQNEKNNMLVSDVFKSSTFVREGIAVPLDMFEDSFRKNFKVENGKVVAYGKDGNQLMSKKRIGEYADPEEALQLLVEQHPQKDVIMKANTGSGTGNDGQGGGRKVDGKTINRAAFDALDPMQQAEIAGKVAKKEMSLVD